MIVISLWTIANIFSLVIILNNDLSASYFNYKDEYWTLFYEKPYSRLPCYLIGVVWGCSYYSYKYEEDELEDEMPSPIHGDDNDMEDIEDNEEIVLKVKKPQNLLISLFRKISTGLAAALICVFSAFIMKYTMIKTLVGFNNEPDGFHPILQYLYLMFNRPVFTSATALAIMPFLLNNPYLYPMKLFL